MPTRQPRWGSSLQGLFVTGTDTDVGKTWITSLIARELMDAGARVGVYKPACSGSEHDDSGNETWPDLRELSAAVRGAFPIEQICPQRFTAALAPPVAAQKEGRTIDAAVLRSGVDVFHDTVSHLLIEGVGGLLCPMTDSETIADLAADFRFPLLVVARANLGTINHTLLTIDVARSRGLTIAGVVLNHAAPAAIDPTFVASNASEIGRFANVPIIGWCDYNSRQLVDCQSGEPAGTDWLQLFACAE